MNDNNSSNNSRDQEARERRPDGDSQRQRRRDVPDGADRQELRREHRRSRSSGSEHNRSSRHRSLQRHRERGEDPRSKSRRRERPEDDRSEVKRHRVGSTFDNNSEESQRQSHRPQRPRSTHRPGTKQYRAENYKPREQESDEYVKLWKERFKSLREKQMRGMDSEQMIDEVFKAIAELIDLIHAFSKGQFPATDEEGRIRKFIDEHASRVR